ncbi:MAG: ComEA family DNA-binding protein [Myxococcaceae bacterium]
MSWLRSFALVSFIALAGLAALPVRAAPFEGVVDLNTGTAEQLDKLPGVGEKAIAHIVEYRTKRPFKRIEELVKVKGFGWKRFQRLKAHITVTQPQAEQARAQ